MSSCGLCASCTAHHGGDLCELARSLLSIVALQATSPIEGLRASEEGITYSLARAAAEWSGDGVSVEVTEHSRHAESTNGADFDLVVTLVGAGTPDLVFGWRVQAKRSNFVLGGQKVQSLERKATNAAQCEAIIAETATAVNLIPVYWLYALPESQIPAIGVIGAHRIQKLIHSRPSRWSSTVLDEAKSLDRFWCGGSGLQHHPMADSVLMQPESQKRALGTRPLYETARDQRSDSIPPPPFSIDIMVEVGGQTPVVDRVR